MEKKKMKIGKKIGIVILILLIIFIIATVRKIIIINDLQNKVSNYVNSTNYYTKITSHREDTINIVEAYHKDEKHLIIFDRISEKNKMMAYINGENANVYYNTEQSKFVNLNSNMQFHVNIMDYLYTENFGQLLIMSILSNIKSVECNEKDCYYIKNIISPNVLSGKDDGVYIEKETGLVIRNSGGTFVNTETGEETSIIVDHEYKFNNVTDEIFIEPDISEYEVK